MADVWGKGRSSTKKASLQRQWSKTGADQKAERHHRNRKRVAEEILSTERSYVKSLDILVSVFYEPICKAAESGKAILSKEDINVLFSNITTIRDLNKKFLADLEDKIANYTTNTTISETLLDFVPYFKMYRLYVENSENPRALAIKHQLEKKTSSTFKKFCANACKESRCLTLPALLITPVQRIPRYRLLVQEYIKLTPSVHPDKPKLVKALEEIKKTATFVNEAVRMSHNRQKILELSRFFPKDPGFVGPSRIYKLDGNLTKKSRRDDRMYRFFLFNDMLAYAKEVSSSNYDLHNKIPIDSTFEVRDVKNGSEPYSFQIVNSKKSFQVFAESEQEKRKWMQALHAATEEFKKTRSELQGGKKSAAAILQTEKKKFCQRQRNRKGKLCGSQFGLFTSRHNCHKCGVLCCDSCSPYKVYLDMEAKKKSRVCTVCVTSLMTLPNNKKLYRLKDLPPPESPVGTKMIQWNEAQNSSSRSNSRNLDESTRSSINGGETHGTLKLIKIRGSDLRIKMRHTPLPYIEVISSEKSVRNKPTRKTFDPEWPQDMHVPISSTKEKIMIRVLDAGGLSPGELIGEATIDCYELVDGGDLDKTVSIALEDGTQTGRLSFTARFARAFRKKMVRGRRASTGPLTSPVLKVTKPPGERD
ncbi:hypothetical protein AAMO2058_000502300 [Amorphochlora amoebiformis]